ncbi:MAG: S8 family serine peptidase, partial [Gammaproteobacteria bacterium]|nr:S8 family serine peptidase [Gammaproteobacteria bacterium]
ELHDEFIPNDPLFDLQGHSNSAIRVDQWTLKNDGDIGTLWGNPIPAIINADIQATEFWDDANPFLLQTNQKTIAIIDIGMDWQHPDFYEALGVNGEESNIWQNLGEDADGDGHTVEWNGSTWIFDPGDINGVDDDNNNYDDDFIGWDLYYDDNDPNLGTLSHGTIVTGGAAARTHNITGMAGSAYYCKIMCLNSGSGNSITHASDAIYYAFENDVDVISMSFGGSFSGFLNSALQLAYNNDILLLASAGNDNSQTYKYPASNNNVISVGGIRPDYERFGQYNDAVEILAPAVDIVSFDH